MYAHALLLPLPSNNSTNPAPQEDVHKCALSNPSRVNWTGMTSRWVCAVMDTPRNHPIFRSCFSRKYAVCIELIAHFVSLFMRFLVSVLAVFGLAYSSYSHRFNVHRSKIHLVYFSQRLKKLPAPFRDLILHIPAKIFTCPHSSLAWSSKLLLKTLYSLWSIKFRVWADHEPPLVNMFWERVRDDIAVLR